MLFVIIKISKFRKTYTEITNEGVRVVINNQIALFKWNEISKVAFQAFVPKINGRFEVFPCLVFNVFDQQKSKTKLANLNSSELGFLKKKNELVGYLKQENIMDIYINAEFMYNEKIASFISNQNMYIKELPPIVKTSSYEEYDKFLAEYFPNRV